MDKSEIMTLKNLMQNLDQESKKNFLELINTNFNAKSIQDIPKNYFEKCIVSLNAKIKYLKDQGKTQEKIMAVA